VPIIIVAGHDEPQIRVQCLPAGAVAYLCNPFDDEELLGAIYRAVGGAISAGPRERQRVDMAGRHPICGSGRLLWLPPAAAYLCRQSVGRNNAALIGAAKALTFSAIIRASFSTLANIEQSKVCGAETGSAIGVDGNHPTMGHPGKREHAFRRPRWWQASSSVRVA
jgi:CheY-like chemotaxis protein